MDGALENWKHESFSLLSVVRYYLTAEHRIEVQEQVHLTYSVSVQYSLLLALGVLELDTSLVPVLRT